MILSSEQIYNWIEHIILSCNSDFQFVCVDKLIELFKQRFPEEVTLSVSLEQLRNQHEQVIQQARAASIQP